MGIKTYQEKNTRAMEKELAQSDLPGWRKIQKTTRNVTFLKYGIFGQFFGFLLFSTLPNVDGLPNFDVRNTGKLFRPRIPCLDFLLTMRQRKTTMPIGMSLFQVCKVVCKNWRVRISYWSKTSSQSSEMRQLSPKLKLLITHSPTD